MTGLADKKSNLRYHADHTYKKFQLHCYILISLIQISILQNVSSDLQKTPRIKKAIDVAIVVKLMKLFL